MFSELSTAINSRIISFNARIACDKPVILSSDINTNLLQGVFKGEFVFGEAPSTPPQRLCCIKRPSECMMLMSTFDNFGLVFAVRRNLASHDEVINLKT